MDLVDIIKNKRIGVETVYLHYILVANELRVT